MKQFDDAGIRPRLRFALADDFGGGMQGVVLENRMRETRLLHAEIGDGGAGRQIADRHADHQPEREQRIHQRLAPFGFGRAEMPVDMQRLRIQRHVGEQHVVHLRDGPVIAVLVGAADLEILEIQARRAGAACRRSFRSSRRARGADPIPS